MDTASVQGSLTILAPFDRPIAIDRPRTPRVIRRRQWLHALDRVLLEAHPVDGLASIAPTTIRLLPYQLMPALSVIDGATRVLIADAVGLGKTIQAGIILRELSAMSDAFRALVLAPAGLREQWCEELASHFGVSPVLSDSAWLRKRASELPRDVNPWSLPGTYVSSHDFVKRPEALRPLEDVTWDLVVLDEAHLVTVGTDRRAAVDAIAARAVRVVMLTATPYSGDRAAFHALCSIGNVGADDPAPLVFARSKADVGAGVPRRSVVLAITPSPAERDMHRLLESYSDKVWKEAALRGDERARLASIVLRKRALSSASSLISSLLRRMALLDAAPRAGPHQLLLPLADEDPLEDEEPDAILGARGLSDAVRERRWLSAILEASRVAARDETKLRAIRRLLRRVREPIIIFTEYRDTLARLERHAAAAGRETMVLHGGMAPAERARVPKGLGNGANVLIATDAAAEGLNLHHRCRIVVHFELPWNAARMEQRAGRVDRLGQQKRPHEIALVASATCERLVLAPLVARARTSRTGYRMLELLGESRVADAIMSGHGVPALPAAGSDGQEPARADSYLLPRAHSEAARLESLRNLAERSERSDANESRQRPLLSCVRRIARMPGAPRLQQLALTYLVSVEANDGRSLHAEPVTVLLDLRSGALNGLKTCSQARAALERILAGAAGVLEPVLRERTSAVHARVAVAREQLIRTLEVRESGISRAGRSAAKQIVQPRLFGRRADVPHVRPSEVLLSDDCASIEPLAAEARLAAALFIDEWRSPAERFS